MSMLRAFLIALLLTSSLDPVYAGSGTITTKDASGVTKTFDVVTDGSGNFIGTAVICDQSAAAQCAAVDSNHNLSVSQATAGNLNATVVGTGTFATQAAQSGTWNITNVSGTVSLPTGAATSALQTTGNTALTTINTTLGSPFQAGGSIGNTTFAATQATGSNLHTVVDSGTVTTVSTVTNLAQMNGVALLMGNGTTGTGSQRVTIASDNTAFSVNATLSAETTKVIGTVRNLGNAGAIFDGPTGAAVPANVLYLGANNAGSLVGLPGDGTSGLWVNIKAGAGSGGTALADGATFTEATTNFTPMGGEYVSGGGANCTTGKGCTIQMTIDRAAYTNSYKWAGGVLGAMANYGTSPGTVLVPGVNAYVTNTNGNGSAVSASSSPVVIASDQAAVAIKAASASIASGAIASGAVASGAIASGAFASGSVGSGAIASGAVASGAIASGAIASGAFASGSFLNATAGDPCLFQPKTNAPISTASGTAALVTGVSAKRIYVCSLLLVAPSAVSISLAEGSSSTCGTSAQAAVIGVATNGTAANGMALAANGGLTLGNGEGTIASTATTANYLCLFQSGTAQIAGNLTYVQQ